VKRVNVRCCCQPTKVLGTMEIPETIKSPTTFRAVPVTAMPRAPLPNGDAEFVSHVIRVEEVVLDSGRKRELAVYAEERPIEFWRQFASFKEGDRV